MRALLFIALVAAAACGGSSDGGASRGVTQPDTAGTNTEPTYDVDTKGIPRFATVSQIDLSAIDRISLFRSAVGHDYHDDFESCRSMKHYFQPRADVDWAKVAISAPVSGKIIYAHDEQTFGTQIAIQSSEQPAFRFIIFHVNPATGVDSGTAVTAGKRLGTHIGTQTMSDLAVGVQTPKGYKLVSWFDVMTDGLFASFQARGVTSRDAMEISRAQRDAAPMSCTGETFTNTNTLPDWMSLK